MGCDDKRYKISSGYGGNVSVQTKKNKEKAIAIHVASESGARKLWHTLRCRKYFLYHRKYTKVPAVDEIGQPRQDILCAGVGRIVVAERTPIKLVYYTKTQKLTPSFYIQRYDANDFALDVPFQGLLNANGIS